jgi:hypothetical protein
LESEYMNKRNNIWVVGSFLTVAIFYFSSCGDDKKAIDTNTIDGSSTENPSSNDSASDDSSSIPAEQLDKDGDGVTALTDCNDDDKNIHPGAADTFENNVDLNCAPDVVSCTTGTVRGRSFTITMTDQHKYSIEPVTVSTGVGTTPSRRPPPPRRSTGVCGEVKENLEGAQECVETTITRYTAGWKVSVVNDKPRRYKFEILPGSWPNGGLLGGLPSGGASCLVGD